MRKQVFIMILSGCMLLAMAGCTGAVAGNEENIKDEGVSEVINAPAEETVDLMEGIELMSVEVSDNYQGFPVTRFGVPMFQKALKAAENDENVLVSPMSAWTALCIQGNRICCAGGVLHSQPE